jgi:ankyrin repeat protein
MAEPLGIAASLIAVAQISGSIISLCYDYRRGIQGAHKDVARIIQEVQSLRNVIEQLLQLLDKDDAGNEMCLPSLKNMNINGVPFAQCQNDLKGLEDRLRTPVNKWQRLGDQLLWPLRERDVAKTLEGIHRMKGIIEFGLTADATASILEIQKNTRDLKERILDFQRSAVHLSEQQELQVMLEWLGAPDPSVKHNDIRKRRAKDTGLWLLKSNAFEAWRDSQMSSLWLHGIPGCGKSVLSSVVIEHIKHRNALQRRNGALAYYYFDFSNVTTSKSEFMLRSLVTQLSAWKGKPPAALADCARKHFGTTRYRGDGLAVYRDGIAQPPTHDLVQILRGIAEEYDEIYLVLDALDECMDQEELLGILESMLAWQAEGLRIFLTSRHTPDIAAVFDSKVAYIIEAGIENVSRDIELFIQEQLEGHPKLRKWPAGLRSEIQNSLMSGAQGMFRWVDCQVGILGKCITTKDVRKSLKALPKSLSETYTSTLAGIEECHWEYAIRILMWLAISPKPLEIREAADILAVDFAPEDCPVFDEDLRVPDAMDIPAMCTTLVTTSIKCHQRRNGGLLETIEFSLAHYTVKEYLLSEVFTVRLPHQVLFANKQQVHTYAAKASLAYLLSLQQRLTVELQKDRPLSRHAAEFWMYHYLRSQEDTSMTSLATRLLEDSGQTEPYKNWCRLFDPSKPWREPDLQREIFPGPLYYASSEGIEPLVLALLQAGADPNTGGQAHRTCLQAATCNGHVGIVKALLKAGARPDNGGGLYDNPIIAASVAGHAEVVALLLEHGAEPNKSGCLVDSTALTEASRRNHVAVVRLLINAGADPNQYHPKPRDVNPLEAAASRGYKDCVVLMLPKASRETALGGLHAAYAQGKSRDLLEAFVDFVPDGVLNYAAALGYEDLVTDLLARGAKPETKVNRRFLDNDSPASALVEACRKGHITIAKQLIDNGADVNAKSGESFSESYAIASAARNGYAEVVRLLLAHGADVNASGGYGPALQIAAYEGHNEIVETLIEHGALLTDGSGSYGGPVQAAVLGDHVDTLELVVAAGADVNMIAGAAHVTGGGVRLSGSPIQGAVSSSNIAMVDWLLEHGADVNLCGNRRRWSSAGPPLSLAAETGNLHMVNRLLDAGADVNKPDDVYGSGPALFWAVTKGHLDVVNRLLSAGADPNALGHWYEAHVTILAEACMGKSASVVRALLEAGADTHRYSQLRENNEPPIHTAARCGNIDMIRVLVQHGADVNEQIEEGWTALHKAARRRSEDIVEALLFEFHADSSLALVNGSLPIHTAAVWNSPECIQLLIRAGSDINARNKSGRTPLHWAADRGAADAVGWLRGNGADDGLEEYETNMTARDYAELRVQKAESWLKDEKAKVLRMFDGHV